MNSKIKLFKVIIAFLVCMPLAAACSSEQNSINHESQQVEQIALFSSLLQLPTESSVEYFHQDNDSDSLTRAILVMSEDDFISWIAKFHLKLEYFNNDQRFLFGPDVGQWNPSSPQELPTGQARFENGKVLNIGYYKSEESGQFRTYIVFHGV